MEKMNVQITSLAEDIRQIIVKTFGEEFQMISLCRDHFNPLIHKDKKPVLDISQNDFVGIFDRNVNHFFISPAQAVRLGEFCELPLPNIIGLLLKAEWECYLSEITGYEKAERQTLGSILDDQDLLLRYSSEFRLKHGSLYTLIKDSPGGSYTGSEYSHVDFIIRDQLENLSFLKSNSRITEDYSKEQISERRMLIGLSDTQRESYFQQKELWQLKSAEFDEMLLHLEKKKSLNINIENKYFETFGKLEYEKSELVYQLEKYKSVLQIISAHPDLTLRKAVLLALKEMVRADRQKIELRKKIIRSQNRIGDFMPGGVSRSADQEYKRAYVKECKKLLKKLYFLLHSDTCPKYAGLSKEQQNGINKLWLELMKSTGDELYSFTPSMLLYSLPNYNALESIYMKACEILGIDPEVFEMGNRLEFMIRKGSSMEEIMNFLANETGKLELSLANLELIQGQYALEDQAQTYRTALENRDQHLDSMTHEISELTKQVSDLRHQIVNENKKAA